MSAEQGYEIRVDGHLDDHWSGWLGELRMVRNGDGTTTVSVPAGDQAQLHGVLAGLRDIGAVILERIDDPALRDEAVSRAKSFLGYGTRPDADALAPGLRAPALSLALAVEGARFFDALVERFRTTVSVTERGDLLRAIGSARDGKLRERALELVFDPAVRKNEVLVLLGAQLARRETRADAFAFLVSRWEPLVAKLGPSTAGSLASLAAYACDPAEAASVEARLAPLADDVPGGPSFLATGLARARDCAARVERERAALSGSPSP